MIEEIEPEDIRFEFTEPGPYLQANPDVRERLEEHFTDVARKVVASISDAE